MKAAPLTVTAATLMLLLASLAGAADSSEQGKWRFDLAVYVWLPTIEGDLGFDVPGGDDSIEVDPSTILDNLKLTGMLAFEARKNRWSALADVIYLDLGNEQNSSIVLPGGSTLNEDARLDLTSWIVQMAGAYEVVRTDRANLGVLVGLRYFSMDTDLDIRIDGPLPPELPTQSFSQGTDLWDGIVGIRGQYGRKWYLPYHLDVGAGSSEFTWQAMAGVGYRWHWGSVVAVYRYLSFDEGDQKLIRDLSFGGPAVGVNFKF